MRIIVIIFILQLASESVSQTIRTVSRTTSGSVSISGKVYDQITGEKLKEKELNQIIKNNPNIVFDKSFDKYGNIDKYFYDPSNIKVGRQRTRSEEKQTKIGETFPEFIFKTIKRVEINSNDLDGVWVLIRFELFAEMMNMHEIIDLENQFKIWN